MKEFDMSQLEAKNICIDPDKVKAGDVFVLLKTEKGKEKVQKALENGAVAVLAEKDFGLSRCSCVESPRKAWALLEKSRHKNACDKLKIIGITGTNGKTTTTFFVASILQAAKKKVAVIGTLGAFFEGKKFETGLTTPDPDKLHELFEKFLTLGAEYVVMEVSAHALALEKTAGITFETAVLTNITQDHLDFFGSMKKYANAKCKLFSQAKKAVVCGETINAKKFSRKNKIPTIFYGFNSKFDIYGKTTCLKLDKSHFFCHTPKDTFECKIRLSGEYNVLNALAAVAVCFGENVTSREIASGLFRMKEVEGRFNVRSKAGKTAIIDFAHTPDGLEKLIKNVRPLVNGKIITIFGCGGNRDRKKRAIMGKIASNLSDEVILTSDNPRFEEPMSIILDIARGIDKKTKFFMLPDRQQAIALGLSRAKKDDAVIIAGKGGEKYQDIGGVKVAYDDFEVVENLLSKRREKKSELER